MDLTFSPQDEQYRERLRSWLDANAEHASFPKDPIGMVQAMRDWQRRLYEAGYIGLAWPKEYGGQEATISEQVIVAEEFARFGLMPMINMVGLNILGPTLIRHGTEAQKQRYLPAILTAEEIWCQGFSEPEAGSDLASLKTRAVLDGDEFVVNGQKVWTSLGPIAHWIFLLVRTDPDAPKREGISYLLCEMKTPGVQVRPLRNAAGGLHFSEVFFDDVRIPAENLVGELNGGWKIARSSLDHERSGLSGVIELERGLSEIRKMAAESGDVELIRKTTQLWIEIEGLRYLGYRALSAQLAGREPGAESSAGKLFATELRQRIAKLALEIEGPYAQLAKKSPHAIENGRWQAKYFDALPYTIGGGTSEVLRNVVAERILGLPRSVEE